jgi:hypothetical protein
MEPFPCYRELTLPDGESSLHLERVRRSCGEIRQNFTFAAAFRPTCDLADFLRMRVVS